MIDVLFSLYDGVSWGKKNARELLEIGSAYSNLAFKQGFGDIQLSGRSVIPMHLVEGVVHRTRLHLELLRYLQEVINMQFTHQHNYIAQMDAEATKTISYLTLGFLPSTFVCAVFSTTIFSFGNWNAAGGQNAVVSGAWWVFLLMCLALSIGTIVLWIGWRGAQG
jgi:hypothetical protein